MNPAIFVEQLSADGEVLHRSKLTELPIRIGRAYDNDLILDDPHSAAHHAQIELNQLDELIISDLGSANGIVQRNRREDFFVIHGDAVYRIGHTRLRIRRADYPVAAEQTDLTNHHWEGLLPGVAGLLLLAATGLLTTWMSDINQGDLSKYLLELVGMLGFALGWSGIWALFSKLFNGQARLGRHLFIVSLGLSCLELWDYLASMLAYAFSWETLAQFTLPPMIIICAVTLYFHMRTAGNKRPGRIKLYLTGLVLLGMAISTTKQYQASNHFGDQLYLYKLYPPALRMSDNTELSQFIDQLDALKTQVDENRKDPSDK